MASLRSFREFQVGWKANKDNFFVPSYSQGVKSAIYYFKKFDTDMSGQLDLSEFRLVRAGSFERAFSQSSAFLTGLSCLRCAKRCDGPTRTLRDHSSC